ncbi:hypothetical protein HK097_003780 [Rhizophlyctis rosea]|uniref:Uncharacterized protein n=1 Tax=Rhizophlyctis rosea TaxID=64517 RepID=A0AAD5S4G4_9FUNG|nr:hypothetical protein HK097_003780 [Rhizophlyctis rosea]
MTDILQPLFPSTTPQLPTTPQPTARKPTSHFHHPHTIYHSQFAQKQSTESSIIPHHVKIAIIEKSPVRAATSGAGGGGEGSVYSYRGEKVLIRNEEVWKAEKAGATAGVKAVAEREKRRKEILSCGYSADPKEPYKALGDPTLDNETLLFETLQIDPRAVQRCVQDCRTYQET